MLLGPHPSPLPPQRSPPHPTSSLSPLLSVSSFPLHLSPTDEAIDKVGSREGKRTSQPVTPTYG